MFAFEVDDLDKEAEGRETIGGSCPITCSTRRHRMLGNSCSGQLRIGVVPVALIVLAALAFIPQAEAKPPTADTTTTGEA